MANEREVEWERELLCEARRIEPGQAPENEPERVKDRELESASEQEQSCEPRRVLPEQAELVEQRLALAEEAGQEREVSRGVRPLPASR